jgi:cytochrome c oxidase subunit 4
MVNNVTHSHDVHDTHHVNYLAVFGVLCVCTALSVVFDSLSMDRRLLIVLVLAVATAKAMCVMMYFMHLKFEGNWKYVLLAPTVILAIGLPLALFPDIGRSYYYSVAPQGQWKSQNEQAHVEAAPAGEAANPETSGRQPAVPSDADGAGSNADPAAG